MAAPRRRSRRLCRAAQVLMLPFFRGREEVERFVAPVRGRAEVMCLVETASSLVSMREIIERSRRRRVDDRSQRPAPAARRRQSFRGAGLADHGRRLRGHARGWPSVQRRRRRARRRRRHADPERAGLRAVSAARRDRRPADARLREGFAAGRSARCGGDPAAAAFSLGTRTPLRERPRAPSSNAGPSPGASENTASTASKPADVRAGRRASAG